MKTGQRKIGTKEKKEDTSGKEIVKLYANKRKKSKTQKHDE
jgi:hypothetical protein